VLSEAARESLRILENVSSPEPTSEKEDLLEKEEGVLVHVEIHVQVCILKIIIFDFNFSLINHKFAY